MNEIIKAGFKIPIYYGYLYILICDNIELIAKQYDMPGVKNDLHDAFVFSEGNRYYLATKQKITSGAIAHEAKHLVNKIFKDRGIGIDIENDEAECYLLGWIVRKIHYVFYKNGIQDKIKY